MACTSKPLFVLRTRALPLLPSTFKPIIHLNRHNQRTAAPFTTPVWSQLKTPKGTDGTTNGRAPSKTILKNAPPPAPSLLETNAGDGEIGANPKQGSGIPIPGFAKKVPRKVLALLSNLPLAIGEMFSIAAIMAVGTVIDQGEKPEFYFQNFPEDNPVMGFLTWRWVLGLGFDHVYSSPLFLGMLALLAASLMACTYTTQIPLVKVARRWSFMSSAESIRKQEFSDTLPRASIQDLGVILMSAGYEVFLKGPSLYAFKGLAGRFAPIGVHIAMLLIMAGGTLSAVGSYRGSVTVPQGLNFVVGDVMNPTGFLSNPTRFFNTEVHVNKFYMDYYDSGEVSQFYTDLSLLDLGGKEVMRKTISVNDPLRFGGFTIYQTDWGFSALQVSKNNEGPFNLAMAPLQINGDKKLYGTFLPLADPESSDVKGISMLARDLQSIVLYDQEGKFAGVRRPGSKLPIDVDGVQIVIEDAIGSSGLQLKTDPGVPVVWALQDGTTVVIGGKTNRAKIGFPDEMNRLLDRVPEIVNDMNDSVA
ncbi:Cytochrome c biogenesis protein [Nymphaea thermarum]|nr:Cytochrome c biogenesis protein [Nymphaea thermarum]